MIIISQTLTMGHPLLMAFFLSLILISFPLTSSAHYLPRALGKAWKIQTIYNFGDSISDTGNLLREGVQGTTFDAIGKLPYGETINKPTGRCSDGLLMIDFLANAVGLPLLNPYLKKDADFTNGVNFAVAGATTLNTLSPITNSSLGVQLEWFKDYLKSNFSSEEERADHLRHALIMVGEIGGNDYNYAFLAGQSISQAINFVPLVVQGIVDKAKDLINLGAQHLIVPGNFPIGCFPIYLSTFPALNPHDYDKNKCLVGFNEFAVVHNLVLKEALRELRKEYPHVHIMYADYYHSFMYLLNNAQRLGFDIQASHKACCGGGGEYNFSVANMCGNLGTSLCPHPAQRISWDGIHLTQNAYKIMLGALMYGGFTYVP